MSKRHFTWSIGVAAVSFAMCFIQAQSVNGFEEVRHPNLLIFLADDQGWGDLSCNGNVNLATPNIDSLAKEGATLKNFYVCAVCAPTRAEFLTGRYHFRTGVSGVSEGAGRLNPDETTLADLLHSSGYVTGVFGKWHNGTQSPYHPLDRGFDEFYGFTSGHWGHYFSPPLEKNRSQVKGNGYLTDDLTDHAIEFIEQNKERPFLCYVPFNTPHSPFYVDDEFYDRFKHLDPEMRHRDPGKEDLPSTRAALAMCENIDWNVGRVLAKLDELKLKDDTIVVYFSDNGPNTFRWNGGMKGKKATVDEGGLRSPFFIRWPGRIAGGKIFNDVTAAIDLLPTLTSLCRVASQTTKPIDGRSYAGMLLGNTVDLPDRDLFSVWRKRTTVRSERFRLDDKGALFDIQNDRGQRQDVSKKYPEIASRLRQAVDEHRKEAASAFAAHADRPFTVGFAKSTTLPARDGVPHGTIQRSSKAPNNSFFTHWCHKDDSITWDIEVGAAGRYRATVFYTCPAANVGATVRLSCEDSKAEAKVIEAFDPPIWDKSKERVAQSHYIVKDFRPLDLGEIRLPKGRHTLSLTHPELIGDRGIDVYSVILVRTDRAANAQRDPLNQRGRIDSWIPLFNGQNLDGWTANADPGAFVVDDGILTAHATHPTNRGHLFACDADGRLLQFKDFELMASVRGEPNSNSGIFFHTDMETRDGKLHLKNGYEIQLNSSLKEKRKTGSLYDIQDLRQSPVDESKWFTVRIRVEGNRIQGWINDRQTVDYTQPKNPKRKRTRIGRLLRKNGGAIALQAHDDKSTFHFREIKIRKLP